MVPFDIADLPNLQLWSSAVQCPHLLGLLYGLEDSTEVAFEIERPLVQRAYRYCHFAPHLCLVIKIYMHS